MFFREVLAKSILSKSKIFDYTINPYTGCQHRCVYCYARFMKRFTGHKESWGQFVDIKVNAQSMLYQEIVRKPPGRVWISGVCDPYQYIELKYELTRKCLEVLIQHNWPIRIQTKSDLVLRDIALFQCAKDIEVGLSITTGNDSIRKLFEPNAPSIKARVNALEKLHSAGIKTFAMIAPMLPSNEKLSDMLEGSVDYILIDRMNYHYGDWVYKKHKLFSAMSDNFFYQRSRELASSFNKQGIKCQVLFLI